MMEKARKKAVKSFPYFVRNIFSASFINFIEGEHVEWTCKFLGENTHTIRVSARVHFKSMSLYAHVMWKILQMRYNGIALENHYFSYKDEMASYHVGSRSNKDNIRSLIQRNIFFQGIIDNKPQAEAILDYSWSKRGPAYTLHPHGMMTFKRGLHCNGVVYVDDALQDPTEKLVPKSIYKINDIFYTQLLDIPVGDMAEIHVAGTAQTEEDFYFDERSKGMFEVEVLPGVSGIMADKQGYIASGKPLWSEWMDIEAHKLKQKSQGIKVYSQEYLCNPVYSADSFFQKWQLEAITGATNRITYEPHISEEVVGGWDLGKHAHPAHFAVVSFKDNKATQIHSKWFDSVNYTDQLKHVEEAIKDLGIESVYYDNTRGELEALDEQGQLPSQLIPINFTTKSKSAMSTEFERHVTEGRMKIINDKRYINQICVVTNDLKARQTKEGHGDSFWSTALCFAGFMEAKPELYISSA